MRSIAVFLLAALLLSVPLARGDEAIRLAQEELRKRNLYHGDIDGRETPAFLSALKQYQQRKNFPPTGVVDADTLRSMGLSEPQLNELPNMTVLRSDRSPPRPRPAAGAAASFHRPPRSSLPAPSRDELRRFISAYLDACASADVADELAFYGTQVNYFHHGVVDQPYIRGLLLAYYEQWPQREYRMSETVRVGRSGDYATARCRISFTLTSPQGRAVSGRTDNTFTLARRADGSLEIIGHQEERVRQSATRRRSRQKTQRTTPLDRTLRKIFGPRKRR